mgnify:CR=1 FL=1
MISVGATFPEFSLQAVRGGQLAEVEGDPFVTLSHESHPGKWRVVFYYPMDFTFVCPTEIAEFNARLGDFEDRDATVLGGSTDNEFSHLAWRKDHDDLRGLKFPLIAAQKLGADLGIIHDEESVCTRATFIVDPQGIIRFASVNDLNVGRNPQEVLRVLDALQTDELCPCNWQQGEEVLQVG